MTRWAQLGRLGVAHDAQGHGIARKIDVYKRQTFDQLMPGAYSVRITLPEGYVYTAGGADSMAKRTDEATVTLDLGELHMGETLGGITVGALKPASLGGVVWFDSDDDGRRQVGDIGVQGATVRPVSSTHLPAKSLFATRRMGA